MRELVEQIAPRTMVLVLAGIVLLVTVLLTSTLLVPQVKQYSSISETRALLESATNSGSELEQLFADTKADVGTLEHALHGEMADLPVQQLESFIIGRLQKISWNTDIELVSVRPGKGETVRNFQEILFEVELTGHYFDFFNWLGSLHNDLGFVVIKTFDISPRKQYEADPELNVRLTMVSYRTLK